MGEDKRDSNFGEKNTAMRAGSIVGGVEEFVTLAGPRGSARPAQGQGVQASPNISWWCAGGTSGDEAKAEYSKLMDRKKYRPAGSESLGGRS